MTWVDGRNGTLVPPAEVVARLGRARVVLVGEKHAEPNSMAVHRVVLNMVAAQSTGSVAVAVEWLPNSARLAASGWIHSQEPVSSLGDAASWGRVWGHDLAAYAPVLEDIRHLGLGLAPINAEPGLARFVARQGPDGVPPERAAELPPLTSGNDAHRAWFYAVMEEMAAHGHGAHGGSTEDTLARLYLAQLVWDETMARHVATLADEHTQVVVLAGTGHIGFGFGIPERLPELDKLVILPAESIEDAQRRMRDAPLSNGRAEARAALREADLFVVVGRTLVASAVAR